MAALRNPNAVLAAARKADDDAQGKNNEPVAANRSGGEGATAAVQDGLRHGMERRGMAESALRQCGGTSSCGSDCVESPREWTCWNRCGFEIHNHGVSVDLAVVWLGNHRWTYES